MHRRQHRKQAVASGLIQSRRSTLFELRLQLRWGGRVPGVAWSEANLRTGYHLATGEFYFDAVCRGEQCMLRICLIDLDADDAGHKFAYVPALEIAFVELAKAAMHCPATGQRAESHTQH